MRINSYIEKTKVEGPGVRFCIWVQGCSIRCKGCANYSMWDKNGGTDISTDALIQKIKHVKNHIEGITFLGGEPLDQIEDVTEISKQAKSMGLSVLVFTGYNYSELIKYDKFKELKKYIDILIDGKYIEEKQDFSRPWVGSLNQNFYFLSDIYNESILKKYQNKFELRIEKSGEITYNGMGKTENITGLIKF